MLFKKLKVAGLLSFGPEGVDLPLRDLNVFIGPNGSGKSNFLEILALLKATPRSLSDPMMEKGGVREWLWKGEGETGKGMIEADLADAGGFLRHFLELRELGGRLDVADERIELHLPDRNSPKTRLVYNFQRGIPILVEATTQRALKQDQVRREESILSQIKDPERYPALTHLQENYSQIRLFRNWSFGPGAGFRAEQNASGKNDFLLDGGENLALALSKIRRRVSKELRAGLEQIYQGIVDIDIQVNEGRVQLYLEEEGGRFISATRLSDGTLRYLCLLAILLHPEPPPLIAIEEPELGLHPDVVPYVAKLLVEASQRTQLVVTTHSQMLVDALEEQPESLIVCERVEGLSRFERLNAAQLRDWLKKYSLGTLWSMGELGGNPW